MGDLLKTWNMENLIDHLIAQNVFVPVLRVIKRHHIERLLKNFDMGTQIMFEHNLEMWRHNIGLPLMVNHCEASRSCTSFSNLSSSSGSHLISGSRESTPPRSPTRVIPYQKSTSVAPDEYIPLATILNDNHKGLMLTEFYTKFNKFQEEQRIVLVGLVAGYYDEKSVQMSLASSYRLEQEILEQRFPNEKLVFLLSVKVVTILTSIYFRNFIVWERKENYIINFVT
ncbi:hypothetical protein RI129_002832 [Pyrocoelia pectoralis]|uniref:Uncharacterized protein n=1 Tax=Pyrocoelia pectoralis TaxID=417401 RepID=A0AAN7VGR3_9COLE